jgi:hypothetical protein
MASILYTAYGFKLEQDLTIRPCGMNSIVFLDSCKAPEPKQINAATRLAYQRGYDTVVFFADDKQTKVIALW